MCVYSILYILWHIAAVFTDVRALKSALAELTVEGIQWLSALPWHVSNCLLRGTVDLREKMPGTSNWLSCSISC